MTAKDYLKAYQAEKREADVIERRIEELERKKKSVQAIRHSGMPRAHEQRDLSDAEASIDELIEKYLQKIMAYIGKETEILGKLEEMKDAEERTVIMLKYVNNKGITSRFLTWYEIAEIMNVSKRTAQYIHGRALQHFPM